MLMATQLSLPLFVYGTLMSDQPAFHFLTEAVVRSAPASLRGVALYNVGRYPLAAPAAADSQILGELHWLQETGYAERLARLDAYEGAEYERVVYWVDCPTVAANPLQAWVYVGQADYAARLQPIPHGDWRAWIRERNVTTTQRNQEL